MEFVPIENYPEYSISREGVVKGKRGKILTPSPHVKEEYLQLGLSKDGKSKTLTVHRLVATTFIPNPDNLPQVDHRDRNRKNNHVDNLRWVSRKTNGQNSSKRLGASSKFMGVNWSEKNKRWRAKLYHEGKSIELGVYVTELAAALAYNQKAIELGFSHFNIFNEEELSLIKRL